MVSALLDVLHEGKTFSQFELAERLHTTLETLGAEIDFLHRAGYIKRVCMPQTCGKKCAGCPVKENALCHSFTLWETVK